MLVPMWLFLKFKSISSIFVNLPKKALRIVKFSWKYPIQFYTKVRFKVFREFEELSNPSNKCLKWFIWVPSSFVLNDNIQDSRWVKLANASPKYLTFSTLVPKLVSLKPKFKCRRFFNSLNESLKYTKLLLSFCPKAGLYVKFKWSLDRFGRFLKADSKNCKLSREANRLRLRDSSLDRFYRVFDSKYKV